MQVHIPREMLFPEAAAVWIESRKFNSQNPAKRAQYVSARTIKDLEQYVRALKGFFQHLTLEQIHVGHLREYQSWRSAKAGANKINQEVGTLIRMLRRAELWTPELEECYEPLQAIQADVPRAMSPEEQQRFLQVASTKEEWNVVYWYSLLALATTATNCELRGLRIGDVNLYNRILMIRRDSAKNKYRMRTIPLDGEGFWAAERLVERANTIGSAAPHHFVFPWRDRRMDHDPLKPMTNSGLKKPFNAVRKAAGLPWLRIHDLRHTAITRMAEAGVPISIIMSYAGHISPKMSQHYTQISQSAKRWALEMVKKGPQLARAARSGHA